MPALSHQAAEAAVASLPPVRIHRLVVAVTLIALALAPGDLGTLTRGLMVDAYVQVSAFVAATLFLLYGAERMLGFNLAEALRCAKRAQVPLAAVLGAAPGCGGAVVVVAAFASGYASFGAVVAALTATMGDAAFLLIATRPDAAAVVLPVSLLTGVASGWLIDWARPNLIARRTSRLGALTPTIGRVRLRDYTYLVLAAAGLMVGVVELTIADKEAIFGGTASFLALGGTGVGLLIWTTSPVDGMTNSDDGPLVRTAEETAFISIWVIGAYLAYEYAVAFVGLNLEATLVSVAPLLPLMAILIGWVPGCGPQVLVTTLYINGLIPFAALMGNAVSNDGDALFPAIALEPRVALWATVYSTIPALIVAYGFYLLAPGFAR